MLNNIQKYNKAIVAGVVGLIALISVTVFDTSLSPDMEIALTTILTGVITTVAVWAVPNRG